MVLCVFTLFAPVTVIAQPPEGWDVEWSDEGVAIPCIGLVNIYVYQKDMAYFKDNGYFWKETLMQLCMMSPAMNILQRRFYMKQDIGTEF